MPPSDAPPLEQWHPKVRKLYEYWHRIRPAPERLPGRQHLDPLDIADLMPNVFMVEMVGDPVRYRYRLVGTRIVAAMQRDVTGRWYDEAHPGVLDHPMHRYLEERWLAKRATWRRGRPWLHVDPDIYEIEQVVLPMARDGETVDLMLIITVFFLNDGREAFR
ncbi:MAG TPA: PAS domain-containing protein [Stellaceae bacterium]|nr:PAS domain-containing protein [Stellaceae bacterium]